MELSTDEDRCPRGVSAMLRITVHDHPGTLTYQLEGSLAGPWLQVLEECWRDTLARQSKTIVCIDLTGVTFIDAAGRACLAAMHRQGAEFIAPDCLTKAAVAEITRTTGPGSGTPDSRAPRATNRSGSPTGPSGMYEASRGFD